MYFLKSCTSTFFLPAIVYQNKQSIGYFPILKRLVPIYSAHVLACFFSSNQRTTEYFFIHSQSISFLSYFKITRASYLLIECNINEICIELKCKFFASNVLNCVSMIEEYESNEREFYSLKMRDSI